MIKLTDLLKENSEESYAKLLLQMSSEKLTDPMDFAEYVLDYYDNPEEYDIDEDSEYYDAIVHAAGQVGDHYKIKNVPGIRNSKIYKIYIGL